MNNEWFFEKFELIADAPGAVARMRELVLDLAMKGKVTDRNESSEYVDENYIKEPSSEELPSNWRLLKFGKFFDIQGGSQPPKNQFVDKPRLDYVQLFQIRDLGEKPVPVYIPRDSTTRFCSEGEILIGRYGASVGKIFWAQNGTYNVALAKFIFPKDAFIAAFAYWLLKSDFFQAKLAGASRSAQAGFNKGDLTGIIFPLPPLAEQKRIVAKVDELMGLCDTLEAQQQERELRKTALVRSSLSRFAESPSSENLGYLFHKSYDIPPSELRKSILTLAVQGKLVPQDPEDEPAAELIDRLEHERASIATEQGVRLPKKVLPINDDSNPHALPETWQWSRIGQLALVIDYGTSQKANNDTLGVPVYRMGNIVGGRLIADGLKYVDPSIDDLPSLFLKTDDILFNRTNSYELVGKAGIYTGLDNVATFASYLIRIRLPSNFLLSSFFNIAMNAPYFRRTQIEPEVVQQCGQANFNGTKLASTIVPVPPLAEQHRIVAKVDRLMALVDELERQQESSREKASNLLDAIVQEMTTDG